MSRTTARIRKQTCKILAYLAILFLAASGCAQSGRDLTITAVPFAFAIGNQVLPAGRYTITRVTDSSLKIMDARCHSVIFGARRTHGQPSESGARLVFHRYHEVAFLAEVWFGGENDGNVVGPSRQEQALLRAGTEESFELSARNAKGRHIR